MYDIIGDVHGHAEMLKDLLYRMGYKQQNSTFLHSSRKAVFVGDIINRGPKIRETLSIVRSMVEKGHALMILGNHEINAIFYSITDKSGKHLGKRWSRLRLDLDSSLKEFSGNTEEWNSHIRWLRHLPLFLDLGEIRVVHACWKDENIRLLTEHLSGQKLSKSFLKLVGRNNNGVGKAFWETTKGVDFQLPADLLIYDSKGLPHRSFRSKWWVEPKGMTFRGLSFESRFDLPDYTIPEEIIRAGMIYPAEAPIVFFGHYCMKGEHNIVTPNLCCLDSCISRKGKLTGYRWNGEEQLKPGRRTRRTPGPRAGSCTTRRRGASCAGGLPWATSIAS